MATTIQRTIVPSSNGRRGSEPISVVSLSSPTKRKPTWVLFGALLVVLSMVLGAWVFTATSERMSVVVAARDIEPGEVVDSGDLSVVEIGRSGALRAIESNQQELVVGRAARGPIPAGTVLNTDLFTESDQVIPSGMAVVGAALEPGAAPTAGLRPGDRVDILGVDRAGSSPVIDAAADAPTATVLASGTVWSIEPAASSSASAKLWVAVLVPSESQGAVAQSAADGLLRLSLVGSGG